MAARFKPYDAARISGRTVFLDTNILIYLFWPTGDSRWENEYAKFLGACIKRKIPLAVDFLVVSEAANRMLRLEFGKARSSAAPGEGPLDFKAFRDSPGGRQLQSDIFGVLSSRLGHFKVVGKAFSASDIAGFLTVDRLDLVDKAIVSVCRELDLVLATNDLDFAGTDIDIVSANPAYHDR